MDYILGKPSSYARRSHAGAWSESQTEFPGTMALDHTHQKLFVVDNSTGQSSPGVGSQIMVFDIDPKRIRTGEAVFAVLGQPDGGTKTRGLAANHVGRRLGLAVDELHSRLFAADGSNNRILVFDIGPEHLKTGMNASLVLGQKDFTSREPGLGPNRVRRPGALAYDPTHQRLFVSDGGNNRVLIFDAKPEVLETYASAVEVMGQPDFNSNRRRTDLTGFAPGGLTYDEATDRLFISERESRIENIRIVVYDVSPGKDLRKPRPLAVLGKPGMGSYDPIVSREQSVWPRLGSASIDPKRQLLVATEGYPGGNRAIIWNVSPDRLRSGISAVEVVGHLDDDAQPDFNRRSANDRATPRNIYPRDVSLDEINHRLFAIDQYNDRVLGWQLDFRNRVLDRDAKWSFGQPDLYSGGLRPIGPTTVKIPLAVAYDSHNERVFISDGWGNRVLVFDAGPGRLKSGQAAIAVIGQKDFHSTTPKTTRAGINFDTRVGTGITPGRPRGTGLTYDPTHDRLFVSDGGNHRILVYDVSPGQTHNGIAASVVIGQPDFTSGSRNSGARGLYQPAALLYDRKNDRLFVCDGNNNRVLVFDAVPGRLENGAAAAAVIGQPDFQTTRPRRTRNGIDGPDGLAYDYENDRLMVSDHGNDRVLIYDVDPHRLTNMPEALFVIGQRDFVSRRLGPVRANEIWDPRGLAFDSEHQRLYISQGFASNIMIHDMARPIHAFNLPPHGVQIYQSAGAATSEEVQMGYARTSGTEFRGGGAALFTSMRTNFDRLSQRESRVVISETGMAAPPLIKQAIVFMDGPDRETALWLTNPHSSSITLSIRVHDSAGALSDAKKITRTLRPHQSQVVKLSTGNMKEASAVVNSERTFSLMATRSIVNRRKEEIVTAVPVIYGPPNRSHHLTLPQVTYGAGYKTRIILLNPGDEPLRGKLNFYRFDGTPMPAMGGSQETAVSVAPHGTFSWESTATGTGRDSGFAVITASSGYLNGGAIVSFSHDDTLITEFNTGRGDDQGGWFPIDTYPTVVRNGRINFQLVIANGGEEAADVRLMIYDQGGALLKRSFRILPPRHQLKFSQVDLIDKGQFKGSVRVASDVPVSLSATQSVVNTRNEVIVASMPSVRTTKKHSGPVIFPAFVDGPESATQFFLLNPGADSRQSGLRFFSQEGQPVKVILR